MNWYKSLKYHAYPEFGEAASPTDKEQFCRTWLSLPEIRNNCIRRFRSSDNFSQSSADEGLIWWFCEEDVSTGVELLLCIPSEGICITRIANSVVFQSFRSRIRFLSTVFCSSVPFRYLLILTPYYQYKYNTFSYSFQWNLILSFPLQTNRSVNRKQK